MKISESWVTWTSNEIESEGKKNYNKIFYDATRKEKVDKEPFEKAVQVDSMLIKISVSFYDTALKCQKHSSEF